MAYEEYLTEPIDTMSEYGGTSNRIVIDEESEEMTVSGYCDGVEAVKQTVFLILNTERYQCPIYSWDYGVELVDLVGKPISYVSSEIQRRVIDALITDDRINGVGDFSFEVTDKRKLSVQFVVYTIYGNFETGVIV